MSGNLKCLGVVTDDKIMFDKHASNVANDCFFFMGKLKSIRRFIDYTSRSDLVAASLVINWEFRNDLPCGVMNITTRLLSPPRSYQTLRRTRGVLITSRAITTVW